MMTPSRKPPIVFLALLGCLAMLCRAAGAAPVTVENGRQLLNGEWLLSVVAPGEEKALAGFEMPMYDDSAMKPVPVPSNWEMQGFEQPRYGIPSDTAGFFRKGFEVADMAPGERLMLRFEGVLFSARVWLNGEYLGEHNSGFTPFEFDITDVAHTGRSNLLAVRVTKAREMTSAFDSNDAWALSGIYRDVFVYKLPPQHADEVQIETDLDGQYKDADLTVRVAVANAASADADVTVRATLLEPGGGSSVVEAEGQLTVPARGAARCVLAAHVSAPRKWTAETPDLYTLRVAVLRDGKVVSTTEHAVGFREVVVDGPRLLVNGVPVKLRGVNRHEISVERGRALTSEDWERDIRLMKQANINTIRTSHYPPAPQFMDLCDRYGFYVIDEVPFGYGDELLSLPNVFGNLKQRLHETVSRDRNHPSVIIWSLGNENPWTVAHQKLIPLAHKLDATRPVLLPRTGLEGSDMGDVLPPDVNILAPHYPSPERLQAIIDHTAAAPRPVVMTEYLHALGRHWFTKEIWDTVWANEASAGGCVWLWADQGIRRDVAGIHVYSIEDHDVPSPHYDFAFLNGPQDRIDATHIVDTHGIYGADGIVDPDRTPQADYYEIRKIYSPIHFEEQTLPASAVRDSLTLHVQNRYDFTDLAGHTYEWTLFEDYEPVASGRGAYGALPPHATDTLTVALDGPARDFAKRRVVEIRSMSPNGDVLDTHQVEFPASGPENPVPEPPEKANWCEPMNEEKPSLDNLHIGNVDFGFVFDKDTGALKQVRRLMDSFPVRGPLLNTWRPLQLVELSQPSFKDYTLLDTLKNLKPVVRSIEVSEPELTHLSLKSQVWYAFPDDPAKGFLVTADYLVRCSGTLDISYEIESRMGQEAPLLELGVAFELPAEFDTFTFAGRGPDTYPYSIKNTEVSRIGKMTLTPTDPYFVTNKYEADWAELANGDMALRFETPAQAEALDFRNVRAEHTSDRTTIFFNPYVKHPRKKNGDAPSPLLRTFKDRDTIKGHVRIRLPMPDYERTE